MPCFPEGFLIVRRYIVTILGMAIMEKVILVPRTGMDAPGVKNSDCCLEGMMGKRNRKQRGL